MSPAAIVTTTAAVVADTAAIALWALLEQRLQGKSKGAQVRFTESCANISDL
jgi:hypothetical protein